MKTLSLKLDDDLFTEVEKYRQKPRNRFFNEAIAFYLQEKKREALREQFRLSSLLVREDNVEVLREFEALEDEIQE